MNTEQSTSQTIRRVATTQSNAFHAMSTKQLGAKQQMVLDCFADNRTRLTREDIAGRTNLKLSSVCGRVRELLDLGLLVVKGSRKDLATHNSQQLLALPEVA
jgi:DNA-binding MarR family transcriptional regulator